MFYNKLRKTAETNYENASNSVRSSFEVLNESVSKFHSAQEKSVLLIEDLCIILNTIANTPIEIQKDIDKALIITDAFKYTRTLSDITHSIPEASQLVIKGLENIWFNSSMGTNSKLISSGFVLASFGAIVIINNKRIADELQAETTSLYRKKADIDRLTFSIEAQIAKIAVILNGFKDDKKRLEALKEANYLDIDPEQKKFLGSIVNKMLCLSELITEKIKQDGE